MNHSCLNRVLFLIFSTCFLSCNSDDGFITKKDNIVGKWEVNIEIIEIRADTINSLVNLSKIYEFNHNGEGAFYDVGNNSNTMEFKWYYQYEPEYFLLTQEFPTGPKVREFKVVENTEDSQIWELETQDPSGIVDLWLNIWTMNKVE